MNISAPNPFFEAALGYAARGWRVFPCSPNDKRPLVRGESAKGARDGGCWLATTDAAQIEAWWRRWPKAMIGVRMGTGSGAIAFDVDCYKADPKTGELRSFEDWLAAIEREIGAALPPTLVSETPRGGRHLLYAPPEGFALEGLGNSRGALPGIVDVRGDGGYIIVGPSVRHGSKATEEGCDGKAYFWLDAAAPVATGPRALFECITRTGKFARAAAPHPTSSGTPLSPSTGSAEDEAVRKYGLAALDNAVRTVSSAATGTRNETLNRLAYGIGRLVGAGALSRPVAHAALYSAAGCWAVGDEFKALKPGGTLDGALDAGEMEPLDLSEVRRNARERAERKARFDARGERGGGARLRPDEPPPWEPEEGRAAASSDGDAPEPPSGLEEEAADWCGDPVEDLGEEVDSALIEACVGFDHSDTDNAKRLLTHFGADLLVREQEGGKAPLWAVWTGTHWDDVAGTARATRKAQLIGDLIKAEAAFIAPTPAERAAISAAREVKAALGGGEPDEEGQKAIEAGRAAEKAIEGRRGKRVTFGVSSKNKARVGAMLDMAAAHLLTPADAFNADPLVVAAADHTLVFRRETVEGCSDPVARIEAIPGHRREDRITRILPTAWNPAAKGVRFHAFLERFMPDPDVRRFLQVTMGLGLVGLTVQILVFHYGTGANGKSVFLEAISRVLGPLAAGLPAEAISGDEGGGGLRASPEIARLYGVPLVRIAEIPAGAALKEEYVKRLTGGERFPARNLFEGYFEFQPRFIPHASGNGYPRVVGTDNGIWRRMRVIHWPVQLAESEWRNFEDVVSELAEEREAILAWMAEGARIYLEEGLVTPAGVLAQTADMRDVNDPVRKFFSAALEITGQAEDAVAGRALYDAYVEWAAGDHIAVNITRFGRNMTEIFEARAGDGLRKDAAGRAVSYVGVRLKPRPATPWSGDGGWEPVQ